MYCGFYIFEFMCDIHYLHANFKTRETTNLVIAPISFWLLLNVLIKHYLKDPGIFIIPIIEALLNLKITIFLNLKNR
jgi:hypothetical protein